MLVRLLSEQLDTTTTHLLDQLKCNIEITTTISANAGRQTEGANFPLVTRAQGSNVGKIILF